MVKNKKQQRNKFLIQNYNLHIKRSQTAYKKGEIFIVSLLLFNLCGRV